MKCCELKRRPIAFSDLVVGAYGSNAAVLLRTRPTFDMIAALDISPREIDPYNTCLVGREYKPCVITSICFVYTGLSKEIPRHICEFKKGITAMGWLLVCYLYYLCFYAITKVILVSICVRCIFFNLFLYLFHNMY